MAEIYSFGDHRSLEEKWDLVSSYYQRVYKITWRQKPPSDQIEDLYEKIGKLNASISQHFHKKPGLLDKFMKKSGLVDDEESSS